MDSKLIELSDGVLVEVTVSETEARPLAGGLAEKVQTSIRSIRPLLVNVCGSIAAAWEEINQDMSVAKAKVELGLSFGGEGNVYIAKATASANLVVTLELEPKKDKGDRPVGFKAE